MASTPAGGPKPSIGLSIVVVAVLVLLLAAVITTSFLGNPWFAIGVWLTWPPNCWS